MTTNNIAAFEQKTSGVELADILRSHIGQYHQQYPLHPTHYKAVSDIMACRTPLMGGYIEQCDTCGAEQYQYGSCGNRHCPKCQTLAKAKWLDARVAELLPVQYFHVVFTLPHEINPVALCNKKIVCNILFKAASETLVQFGKNNLGGNMGLIGLLHTWDQRLLDHFHLHCVVPGGALSFDETDWINCPKDYLFPVKALSKVFRAKFMEYLKAAHDQGKFQFPGNTESLGLPGGFRRLTAKLWSKDWVVYAKEPFARPEQVLEYLARYTHRIAISNDRIIGFADGKVTFRYRDRQDNDKLKTMTLDVSEFIRRFLLHVIPKKYMRIRHFGILANRAKKEKLKIVRGLLRASAQSASTPEKSVQQIMLELTGHDITLCPYCKKGQMTKVKEFGSAKELCYQAFLSCLHMKNAA